MADTSNGLRCPHCDAAIEDWHPICINCGFNLRLRPGYVVNPEPDEADAPAVVDRPPDEVGDG